MVFRSTSQTLRDLLLGKKDKGSAKRSTTPRNSRGSAPAAPALPGFRVVVPHGSRPGQVIRVQGPDGQQVDVTIPENAFGGQAMWVQIPAQADRSASSSARPDDAVSVVQVLEMDALSARDAAQQRLLEEMQLQMALWASAEAAAAEAAAASVTVDDFEPGDAAAGPRREGQLQVAAAMAEPGLSQTQATLLAAAEVGDGAQLLAALEEAKRFSVVSISLQEAAKGLQEVEEAMLTWRCLRKALVDNDRHEIEVWLEHATSLGLEVPKTVEKALEELREQEQNSLESFENQRLLQQAVDEKKRDVEERLRLAETYGDPELLAQVREEARRLGVSTSEGSEPKPPPPQAPQNAAETSGEKEASAPKEESFEDSRTTKELLEECKRLGLDTTGCQDREDLIRLLRSGSSGPSFDPRSAPKPPPPAAPRPPVVTPTRVTATTAAATTGAMATVWDRQRVPPRYTVHKRYEAMYLLGLDTSRLPSGAELRSAYRKAAMESHPDRQQNHDRQDEAKRLFQRVKDAFDHLNAVVR